MSQLIKIRRQIKSIQTTKKITYAMRLISMSLYSRLEKINAPLAKYKNEVETLFKEFTSCIGPEEEHLNKIIFPQDPLDCTPLIILVSSTKGLCGSFNANIIRYFKRHYFLEDQQTPYFITVGNKATNLVKEENLGKLIASFDDFNSNNFLIIANKITEIIVHNEIVASGFSSVTLYGNTFKSFFAQIPKKTTIIPLQENNTIQNSLDCDALILEQESEDILQFLATRYIKTNLQILLFQSLLGEQASRFLAMDGATTNAENFLNKLQLRYNKSRQALITKELTELCATFAEST